ncbi:MAG: DNA-3-methyladenine glycosylase family protein, partial [Planctomycetota bacterium]
MLHPHVAARFRAAPGLAGMAGSSLLDPRARAAGNAHLAAADPALAGVLAANAPLRFARPRGSLFAHLCRVITAQQISVAAADAIHDRLVRACSRVNPAAVCALELPGLQRCGLSQAKALSLLQLAAGLRDGRHRLHALGRRSDDEVRRRLIEIRGIGPWSADMVLVFRLHRPD